MNSIKNIKCPKCSWKPTGERLWICTPKCKNVWDTFSSAGICPKCSKRWKKTACPTCHSYSLHHDWYYDLGTLLKKELEKIEKEFTTKDTLDHK